MLYHTQQCRVTAMKGGLRSSTSRDLVPLIPQIPLLHPPHAEQVGDADERAVAEAGFRGAGEAVRVLDGGFVDRVTAHLHQRWEVAMGASEELDLLDRVGAVDLEA